MRVTRFQYPLEGSLISKLDLMIKRCTDTKAKKDTVLLCEGSEGEGKTTFSIAIAYYVSEQTGRPFSEANVFFDIEKLIEFAQSTKEQIIIYDEPALQMLSTDWASEVVKNLTRLLMMARKKRHFMIINVAKFYKFNEYVVVDRPVGMIHCYSRHNLYAGRFIYIRKKKLEALWRDYRFSKKRNYKKYASKRVRGTFPDVLSPDYKYNVLKEFDVESYERNKDKAIMSIGINKKKEKEDKEAKLMKSIAFAPGLSNLQRAQIAGCTVRQIRYWREKFENEEPSPSQKPNAGQYISVGESGADPLDIEESEEKDGEE